MAIDIVDIGGGEGGRICQYDCVDIYECELVCMNTFEMGRYVCVNKFLY